LFLHNRPYGHYPMEAQEQPLPAVLAKGRALVCEFNSLRVRQQSLVSRLGGVLRWMLCSSGGT